MHNVQGRLAVEKVTAVFLRERVGIVDFAAAAARKVVAVGFPVSVELDPVRVRSTPHAPGVRLADPKSIAVVRGAYSSSTAI